MLMNLGALLTASLAHTSFEKAAHGLSKLEMCYNDIHAHDVTHWNVYHVSWVANLYSYYVRVELGSHDTVLNLLKFTVATDVCRVLATQRLERKCLSR